jgi:hypothetical protein
MASMVTVKCKNKSCRQEFQARVADRKRGWGKFCSKSCKAIHQERITDGQYKRHQERQDSDDYSDFDNLDFHPYASGFWGHGQE